MSLHGTYGMLWCLKELIFPDPNWQKPCSLLFHVIALAGVLLPYWYFPYSINSKRTDAGPARIALCVALHTVGCVIMMASDTQKFFVLKVSMACFFFSRCWRRADASGARLQQCRP